MRRGWASQDSPKGMSADSRASPKGSSKKAAGRRFSGWLPLFIVVGAVSFAMLELYHVSRVHRLGVAYSDIYHEGYASRSGGWPARRACQNEVCVDVNLGDLKALSHDMYGMFFEEINHSGEGGLHPELLRDFSFEGYAYISKGPKIYDPAFTSNHTAPAAFRHETELQKHSMDPSTIASAALTDLHAWSHPGNARLSVVQLRPPPEVLQSPSDALRESGSLTPGAGGLHALRLEVGPAETILLNAGHTMKGFPINKGRSYVCKLRVRSHKNDIWSLSVALLSVDTRVTYAEQKVGKVNTEWVETRVVLTAQESAKEAALGIKFEGPGALDFDFISLTPSNNWQKGEKLVPFNHQMLEALSDLMPRFLRFPGGAYVEGTNMSSAYRWKAAVGPREWRPGHPNANWGYWSTDGLGLFEFMQLAEALDAEPVWVVNAGISQGESVSPEEAGLWVKDALDSLEFIMGGVNTKWGQLRASMGRAEPWSIKYLTIGNEDCLRPWYKQHYTAFASAIRARYPALTLIANCDLGDDVDFDVWEFHTYGSPQDTFALRELLDTHQGSKPVAITEFAAIHSAESMLPAAAEAGLMSAMERNSDKVVMVAYAPLLGHTKLRTWKPTLLQFDEAGRVYTTPSYHVQKLYRQYMGLKSAAVSLLFRGQAPPPRGALTPLFSSLDPHLESSATCQDKACHKVAVKLVNFGPETRTVMVRMYSEVPTAAQLQQRATNAVGRRGGPVDDTAEVSALAKWFRSAWSVLFDSHLSWAMPAPELTFVLLSSGTPTTDRNSLDQPVHVAPKVTKVPASRHGVEVQLPAYSLGIVVVEYKVLS